MAANRVGKSTVGGIEVALHLTGAYPPWWPGKRFSHPTKVWIAGDTSNTVRDILQEKMMGPPGEFGTGLIPKRSIDRWTVKRNVPDAIQDIYVRHASGGNSVGVFKSFDQKRESFQGTEQDCVWLDEESPMDIYAECLLRTMTTGGMIICTFTPLKGMSDVVLSFLPGGKIPNQESINMSAFQRGTGLESLVSAGAL